MGLMLLGERLDAEQAERWGLIWRVYDDDSLMPEAEALARALAERPTRALALTRRALTASANNSLDQQLDLERDLQGLASRTDDYREGVSAFREKRRPEFTGD